MLDMSLKDHLVQSPQEQDEQKDHGSFAVVHNLKGNVQHKKHEGYNQDNIGYKPSRLNYVFSFFLEGVIHFLETLDRSAVNHYWILRNEKHND